MSLNQVELNDIVLDNLNRFYAMCSVPPVQHHYIEWLLRAKELDLRSIDVEFFDPVTPVEDAFKKCWSFKHWYMQKYFGDHVDALMQISLEPDSFRYYQQRYQEVEERAPRVPDPESRHDQRPSVQTSEPSSNQESQDSADLQGFAKNLETKEIVPAPFICHHYTEQYEPCTHQCKWCSNKESIKNASTKPETGQESTFYAAADSKDGKPEFLPGAKIGDPPGFTWCNNEATGGDRCQVPCEPCLVLPSPDELRETLNKMFDQYKPGTDAQE